MYNVVPGARRAGGFATSLAILAFAFAAASPAEAAELRASAWIPYWAQDEASRTVSEERELFDAASPFWYSTDSQGRIQGAPGAGSGEVRRRIEQAGLDSVPTVTAPIGPTEAVDLLGSRESRTRHIRRIVELAKGFDGIDLNYEHPALTTRRRKAQQVRDAFNEFFPHVCRALQRNDRQCVVTVMPRTESKRTVWRGKLTPWVYDYRVIGQVADRVRVMAYDQHAGTHGPGPIAGAPWTRRIAEYSAQTIPPANVELGIPLYGRMWADDSELTSASRKAPSRPSSSFAKLAGETEIASLTWREATSFRRSCGAEARWSETQLAPWFRCEGRTVWYSNARSTRARAQIAAHNSLGGIALWAPYGEDPATWRNLRRSGLLGN